MPKTSPIVTPDKIRSTYLKYIEKGRMADPEAFMAFADTALADFIRRHVDANFSSIYERTDSAFYKGIRNNIPVKAEMREEDDTAGHAYNMQLRKYADFLQSHFFSDLFKPKQKRTAKKKEEEGGKAPEDGATGTAQKPRAPKEREMTEGEKEHVELERAHRNPALRQACLDKYGYQCQCCGMDFASLYGEELGANFIEVHHLKMISTYDENRPEDYVENLVPLCSNCHSMIHHGPDGPLTLGQLRAAYRGDKEEIKSKIKVWKED